MGRKIVLQNEIDQQYNKFNVLTKNFYDLAKDMSFRLSLVSGAFKRSGGQTTIISTCRLQSRCLLDIAVTLHDGAELLRMSKETMRNLDATIRQEINNKDIPSMGRLTFGDTTSDTEVWESEEAYWYSKLGKKTYWNPLWEETARGYFSEGQCTWYAYIRFMSLFPTAGLGLGAASGNAKEWLRNNEGRDHLDVQRGGWDILDSSRLPCIAVSENGYYGHVYIIEGVTYNDDGSIKEIIYSECNGYNHEQNAYSNNGIYNEGIDCVYDKARPDQLGLSGFIYYAP